MSPTDQLPNPFSPFDQLVQGLLSTALHLCVGLVLARLAVELMRRRHLRWTWALTAVALPLAVRTPLTGWGLTLVSAALWTTVRSRALHLADLRTGRDLAAIATARRGPSDALRRLWATRGRSSQASAERIALGRTRTGACTSIPLGMHGGNGRHTLVVGTTGSGKTFTLSRVLAQAIERGLGAVVVDPKGDAHLRDVLAGSAQATGRRFVEWTPSGPAVYNPLAVGTPSAIADKALASERFTEPHYQRQAQRYLGHAARALREAGHPTSLRALVEHLDPDRLEVLARGLPSSGARRAHEYLDQLSERQRSDLSGVRDRLAILVESDVAPWLDPDGAGLEPFDLLQVVRERSVTYFSLEADAWPLLAHMLAAAIVQDLQSVVAALQADPVATLVAIDEFSAVAPGHVARLFGRARSAGVSLLLGTQELSDLRPDGHERLLEQVLGNLSALIVHRQVVPESIETIAEIAGSRFEWAASHSSGGRWTRTRVRRTLLDGESVRTLPTGRAIVIEPAGGPPSIVQVQA